MNTQPTQSTYAAPGRQTVTPGHGPGRDPARPSAPAILPGGHQASDPTRAAAHPTPVPLQAHDVPLRLRVAQHMLLQTPCTPRHLRAVEYLLVSALTVRDPRTGFRKLLPEDRADALLTWLLEPLPVLSPGLELKEYLTLIEEALTIAAEETFIEGRLLERARALKYKLNARFATRGALKASVQCLVLLERVWCEPGFRRSLPPGEGSRPPHAPLTLLRLPLERQLEGAERSVERGAERGAEKSRPTRVVPPRSDEGLPAISEGTSGNRQLPQTVSSGLPSVPPSVRPSVPPTVRPSVPPTLVSPTLVSPVGPTQAPQEAAAEPRPRRPQLARAPSGEVITLPAPAPSAVRAPWLDPVGVRDSDGVRDSQLLGSAPSMRSAIPNTRAELLGGLGRPDAAQGSGVFGSTQSAGFQLIEVHGQRPTLDPGFSGGSGPEPIPHVSEGRAPAGASAGSVPEGPDHGAVHRVAQAFNTAVSGFKRAFSSEKIQPSTVPTAPSTSARAHSELHGVEDFALTRIPFDEAEPELGTHPRPVPVPAPWTPGGGSSARVPGIGPMPHAGGARAPEQRHEISERLPAAALQLANDAARVHKGAGAKLHPSAVFPANLREGEGFIADPNPAFREEPPPAPAAAPWEDPGVDQDALMREIWALALPGVDPDQPLRTSGAVWKGHPWERARSSGSFKLAEKSGEFREASAESAGVPTHRIDSHAPGMSGIRAKDHPAHVFPAPVFPAHVFPAPVFPAPPLLPDLNALLGAPPGLTSPETSLDPARGLGRAQAEGASPRTASPKAPERARGQVEFAGVDERDELEALGLELFRPPPSHRGESPAAGHEDTRSLSVRRVRREVPRSDGTSTGPAPARVALTPLRMGAVKPEAFRAAAQDLLPHDSPSHDRIMPTLRTWKTSSPLKALATGASASEGLAVQGSFSLNSPSGGSALSRLGAFVRESVARGGKPGRDAGQKPASGPVGVTEPMSSAPRATPGGAVGASAQAGGRPPGTQVESIPIPPWEQRSDGLASWLIRFQPGRPIRWAAAGAWLLALGLSLHLVSEPSIPFEESPEAFQAYRIDALAGGVPILSARRLGGVLILTAAPEWTRLKPYQNQRLLAHLSKYLLGQEGIVTIVVVDSGGRLLAQLPVAAGASGGAGR